LGPNAAEELEAIRGRHDEIRDHQVRLVLAEVRPALGAVCSFLDREAPIAELVGEGSTGQGLIVDYKNVAVHGRLLVRDSLAFSVHLVKKQGLIFGSAV
jgi:hypothetical protein